MSVVNFVDFADTIQEQLPEKLLGVSTRQEALDEY